MDCYPCRSIASERRISPGPFIYEGQHWVIDHAYPTLHKGWLVIVPRRHVEALHELSRGEFTELAELQYKLTQVMRQDAQTQKEYMVCFSEAEHFRHVHIHFIPRWIDLSPELRGPLIFTQLHVDEEHAVPATEIIAFCQQFKEQLLAVE